MNLVKLSNDRIANINNIMKLFVSNDIEIFNKSINKWINLDNSSTHEFIDEILQNHLDYIINNEIDMHKYINEAYIVFKNNNLTANPHIKSQYLDLLFKFTKHILDPLYWTGAIENNEI